MGPKVTDYEFLVKVLNEAKSNKQQMEDFVANLMQKDELIEVGIFKLENSANPKPEALPKELALQTFTSSIFAGTIYTSDGSKIAALVEKRNPDV